ncbi:Smr/MutS family protein [Algicella marina]|uniref:DNA mismatch repair protein MutS n=1 Tax=Algicella marina TaxID=2683284 RepID=A0A6P1T5L6_9RHOB|nr:Smr/MutS family protein [Algicella marina]QHQ36589.1 DNA mismatch repair protein MutS [Algicella marina]
MARKRRGLSSEDQELWDQVRQTAKPLIKGDKLPDSTSKPAVDISHTKTIPKPYQTHTPFPHSARSPKGEPKVRFDLAPDPMERLSDSPIRTDRRTHDKLRKGRMTPDARVDLHGMTAERAHGLLTSFILRSHAQGHRLVLVITGKGRTPGPESDAIAPRRGILRHAVPQWLNQGVTAHLIVQILPAHRKHGGGGAYYVYLRRSR